MGGGEEERMRNEEGGNEDYVRRGGGNKKVNKVRKDGKRRKREAEGVRVKECTEHVRMERRMEGCRRSMAHNVTPDIAETEINTLSVSRQENWKVSPRCCRIQTVTAF